jgi:hypothetical protein
MLVVYAGNLAFSAGFGTTLIGTFFMGTAYTALVVCLAELSSGMRQL